MQLDLCQRWYETEEHHEPADSVIDTRAYEVAAIPDDRTARTFIARHHYMRGYASSVRFRYGLYRGPRLEGVAVFSVPMRYESFKGMPLSVKGAGIELSRLVLLDGVAGNGESWFVSRCFHELRREGLEAVLSFSDPVPRTRVDGRVVHKGHWGKVYQALSACYTGLGTKRTLRLLPDGTVANERSQQKVRAREIGGSQRSKLVRQLLEFGAEPFDATDPRGWLHREIARLTRPLKHSGNHRFLWALDRRLRKHLPPSLPYPDPPWGRVPPKWGRRAMAA